MTPQPFHDRFVINSMALAANSGRAPKEVYTVGHTASRIADRHFLPMKPEPPANDQ